jgi:flagellar motor protein MotB
MRYYHDLEVDSPEQDSPGWMTLFISLMLVLLTLFIFLTTYVKGDKRKIREFKIEFKKSLMLPGKGDPGTLSITDVGTEDDPVQSLLNRMKSTGINKKLMDDFLTLQQIKDFEVVDGKNGVSVILPEVVSFSEGRDGLLLSEKSREFLSSISFLIKELPYLVEIKGYSTGNVPKLYPDALEYSARRAHRVYTYLLRQDITPVKLKVSGCGDAFEGSSAPQNKVEIIFMSADL